jgi:hypothetical protein
MIDLVRMLTPRLSLAAAAFAGVPALATGLAAPAANGQIVHIPAPLKPSPRPVWNCRARQSVGTTNIYASRQLDAAGASLTDGAGWTDAYTADKDASLTVSVNWHAASSPMNFADGMMTFFFRAGQPMTGPLSARLEGRRTIKIHAGQAYDNPREFTAYVRIGELLDAAGNEDALKWALRGTAPGKGKAPVSVEGPYTLGEVRALRSGFAKILAEFDLMQADFAKRCRRL